MDKATYLQVPDIVEFIDWAIVKLKVLKIHHHVKGRGRSAGHEFMATGIEAAASQYDWACRIDPDFLPHGYKSPEGNPRALSYNMTVLTWLRNELRASLKDNDALRHFRACLAILSWGGVDNGARATNVRFYTARYVKDNGDGQVNDLLDYHRIAHDIKSGWAKPEVADDNDEILSLFCKKMSAGITKIHALMEDELVIYDSRVAAALTWLIELYCSDKNMSAIPDFLQFLLPEEQGKNEADVNGAKKIRNPSHVLVRPKKSGVRHEYRNTQTNNPAEWMQCKLRASWLVSGVLEKGKEDLFQNEKGTANKFMLFQLGLFMIGYDLQQKSEGECI